MNTRLLQAFVCVVQLKSFRAAAKQLNVSPATISNRIAALETEFGVRLIERDHMDTAPTNAGYTLLGKAERVLKAEYALHAAMKDRALLAARVRLGVIESVVHTWLGSLLERITRAYPKIEIELTAGPTSHLHDLFARGALDVIVQTDPVLEQGVINQNLVPLELVWAAPSNSSLVGRTVTLSELAQIGIITFTRGSRPHHCVEALFDQHYLTPQTVHCVTSISAIVSLVRNSGGVATLPRASMSADLSIVDAEQTPDPLALVASWRPAPEYDINSQIVELCHAVSEAVVSGTPSTHVQSP